MSYTIKNETISNDIVFGMAMQQKPDLARRLIALSTDTNEALLETAEISGQKGNKPTIFSKGTRFDIYLATDTNIYDLEMQTRDSALKDIALRARYYASSNDVTELKPGCNYRELKSLTIIFLCTFDPFKKDMLNILSKNVYLFIIRIARIVRKHAKILQIQFIMTVILQRYSLMLRLKYP